MKEGRKDSRDPAPQSAARQADVTLGQWSDEIKPVRRAFPGPAGAIAPLRVAFNRRAFADVVSHAQESLDAEICGVLAGQVCEDDEGLFLDVEAAIRGASARESNARVTFTQETWNALHTTLERDYPKLRILGWYHSHPGFGVEFSEMDVFIQKNFFPAPTQIALVTDPLGGESAMCRNGAVGIEYLDRFWVDGREHVLRPAGLTAGPLLPGQPVAAGASLEAGLQSLEVRLGQLIQVVDDQRASYHRFLLTLLIIALLGVTGWVGWTIYSSYTSRLEPPQLSGYVPIPVRVGDKTVLIGVGVVQWNVPPELNAVELELAKEKNAAASGTGAAGSPPAASPTPPKQQ